MNGSESNKLVIGLYGEMRLAMELHKRGWQVYRAYIDPKIRYHLADSRVFYVWIQVWDQDTHDINYYIFKTSDVKRFDNLELDTYQITDNQKTTLTINKTGEVLNKGRKYDFSAFKDFHNNFDCLEERIDGDSWK